MRNIKLTVNGTGRAVVVNWDNVNIAKETKSVYGDDYVEIHFGDQYIDVKETLQDIEQRLMSPHEKFEAWRDKDPSDKLTQLG